jgi:hypothetical protein
VRKRERLRITGTATLKSDLDNGDIYGRLSPVKADFCFCHRVIGVKSHRGQSHRGQSHRGSRESGHPQSDSMEINGIGRNRPVVAVPGKPHSSSGPGTPHRSLD